MTLPLIAASAAALAIAAIAWITFSRRLRLQSRAAAKRVLEDLAEYGADRP